MLGGQDTSCPENITDGTQSSVYLHTSVRVTYIVLTSHVFRVSHCQSGSGFLFATPLKIRCFQHPPLICM